MTGGMDGVHESTPLLGHVGSGKASIRKTYGNIIISIVGAGVLGLPYTFRISGWAVGSICVTLSAILSYYCMMLMVKCRDRLNSQKNLLIRTYGDLGAAAFGPLGMQVVDVSVSISQVGCCVSYLIFIGQNLSSVFSGETSQFAKYVILLIPAEMLLACVTSLAGLAPFSIFADACNVLAMGIVIKDDIHDFTGLNGMKSLTSWSALPFAMGVAIYCYEGFGMTLSLQSSMQKPQRFGKVLGYAFTLITIVYVGFGFVGYMAFGDETQDIITLNLPNDWTTVAVKLGLSIGLFFTFPVMLYPVHEIFVTKVVQNRLVQKLIASSPVGIEVIICRAVRGVTVIIVATVAIMVPGFGIFISLVGSTVCALLAFVLPGIVHLKVCGDDSALPAKVVDLVLIVGGLTFALYGTYRAVIDLALDIPHSDSTPRA